MIVARKNCRLCGALLGKELIAFDSLPVAGAYVSPQDPPPDPAFPLTLIRCTACGLVQLGEPVGPRFYSRYSFISGVATGYRNYLGLFARHLAETLGPGSRILEVGRSDGTLLQFLRDSGFIVYGFEPAKEPFAAARARGLAVMNEFFCVKSASCSAFERANPVIIRHVLEHIEDFSTIFAGIDELSEPDATLVIEVPDLTSTVERSMFTNVYHSHCCYFDVETMSDLLEQYGWQIAGSTVVDIFGGSLLLWARRKGITGGPSFSFQELARQPVRAITNEELNSFVLEWKRTAQIARAFFDRLRDQGTRIAGYRAAERTTSMIGASGLNASHISVIFDRNPHLAGRMLPVSRIPILHPDGIARHNPEYLIIFAQSFEDEIIREQVPFHHAGGRFISVKSGYPRIITA
jgi:hypothetical protein